MAVADVRAVVVHHRSPDTIGLTVQDVVHELGAEHVLVVDNSEDDEAAERLRTSLPDGVELLVLPNRGYAAAVNAGVRHWAGSGHRYTLVSTHECRFQPGSIQTLADALEIAPDVGVVGPTLIDGTTGAVWSQGGLLTSKLRLPRHRGVGTTVPCLTPGTARVTEADWVDGACLLYRNSALLQQPLSEKFQMYFEELDHQLLLRRAGWRVGFVPAAVVTQSTKGLPPYWLARNLWLMQRRHFGRTTALVGSAVQVTRVAIRSVVNRDFAALPELGRGLVAPRHEAALVVLDLIRSANSHEYSRAWARTVESCGYPVKEVRGSSVADRLAPWTRHLSDLRMLWRARRWSRTALYPVPVVVVTRDPLGWPAAMARLALGRRAWLAFPTVEGSSTRRFPRPTLPPRALVHDREAHQAISGMVTDPTTIVLVPQPEAAAPRVRAWMERARKDIRGS